MKNQYFGDVNDYCKYGLLRCLSNEGAIRTAVAWMLTEDDGSSDGRNLAYLGQPERWRTFDPALFDALGAHFSASKPRAVAHIETNTIIPSAVFHSAVLTDDRGNRSNHFAELRELASGTDLVFFDPDNGIEVKSVLYGRKRSSKYVYWNELSATFERGHSLLVYQHFPRVKRMSYLRAIGERLQAQLGPAHIIFFHTATVVFVLAIRQEHGEALLTGTAAIERKWSEIIRVHRFAYIREIM